MKLKSTQEDINVAINTIDRDIAKNDFHFFYMNEFMHNKENITVPGHIKEWAQLFQRHPYLMMLAPRGHLKTTLAQAFALWRIKYYDERGYIFSVTDKQAGQKLKEIQQEIENNPKFHELIPKNFRDSWSNTEMEFNRRHHIDINRNTYLKSKGYGAAVRGGHPDFMLFDDIMGDRETKSPHSHQFIIDFFNNALKFMIGKDGMIIFIGTKFDHVDIYSWLEQNKKYFCKTYKAIIDESSKKVLWPKAYPYSYLAELRGEDTFSFNREMQNEVVDQATSLFPMELMNHCKSDEAGMQFEPATHSNYILSIDPPNNFLTLGIRDNGKIYICNYEQPKIKQDHELLEEIQKSYNRYKHKAIVVEENYIRMITNKIREMRLPFIFYNTGGRDKVSKTGSDMLDKTGYITRLQMGFKNKLFVFPFSDKQSRIMTAHLFDELNRLRLVEGKIQEVGAHTHSPICLGAAFHYSDKYFSRKRRMGKGF